MSSYIFGFTEKQVFMQSPQTLEVICKKLAWIIVEGVADFLMPFHGVATELFSDSNFPWIIQS